MEHNPATSRQGSRPAWRLIKRALFPEWLFNRRVRISRSGYIFMVLVAFMGGAAFNTGNNLLYLVLAMLLAAMLFSFSISEYMIAGLKVTRRPPHTVTQGRVFTITYEMKNKNRLVPALAMTISENLEAGEAAAYLSYLPARQTKRVRGKALLSGRGRTRFMEAHLSTAAPLGFFNKTRRFNRHDEIIALPSYEVTKDERDMLASLGQEVAGLRRGRGEELFGFREYVRGDEVRDIHWKTSARTGKLMIKEKEREEERRLRICLDLVTPRPNMDDEKREQAVRKAASLAASALETGFLVRVECNQMGLDFGGGAGHLQSVLYFLAMFDDPQMPAGVSLAPDDSACVTVS